ncbi:MAG: N-6 DNA methylase [Armatimonadetes bacterium]|nr:N-6 DNA methylase [Armatimonadota bacterium]
MLDADTKRRIDSCRDMLVGKVPDPKSQVEQITIALIYKFMDDMDAASEELGGKRTFFAGEFERYAWPKLMAPSQGGFEMLALYSEAIARMNENPGVPELFRTIFKNAYLPYRDPETLRAFLKEINTFSYDHSEKLGDAFEYLLSVLGSQGDAGQFRTPRHIIDFLVEVVDPKKDERVLDPACGTAGFLISSYKHIVKQNSRTRPGDLLTADERTRLAKNFIGYDISPDMVRLSLVNLYLHGFLQPQIEEYDTLTQDEKWNEHADVILANPPFMSPKGGIKPHKRFSVQATRSEVLFVDYMAEHLTPGGRAGIVVPEGIIFQSGTAYKQLRKLLVDDFLIAVISLPAGVFQPYSGVKTSILVLDKRLAKRTESVLFVKIESDGFSLGAQRREIAQNDLETAKPHLAAWRTALEQGIPFEASGWGNLSVVEKSKIAETGDYNLSGERYHEVVAVNSVWPLVPLGQVTTRMSGGTPSKANESYWHGSIPWVSPKDMKESEILDAEDHISKLAVKESSTKLVPPGTILCVVRSGILKHSFPVAITRKEVCFNQDIVALSVDSKKLDATYLLYLLKTRSQEILAKGIKSGVTVESFSQGFFSDYEIPLPPLDTQREIVAEIEGYQKIIDGARQVVESYKPRIPVSPDWPMVELGDMCDIKSGGTPNRETKEYWEGDIPWITTKLIDYAPIVEAEEFITKLGMDNSSARLIPAGTVLMAMYGQGKTRGRVAILAIEATMNQACAAFLIKSENLNCQYLFRVLESRYDDLRRISEDRGGNQSNLSAQVLKKYQIPVPDLATQQAIVAEIEAEQRLVDGNKELIRRFEEKIKATINRVWGEAV